MSLVEYLIQLISVYGELIITSSYNDDKVVSSVTLKTSDKGVRNGLPSQYDSNYAELEDQLIEISKMLIRDNEGRI